jgi:hypothetical protein
MAMRSDAGTTVEGVALSRALASSMASRIASTSCCDASRKTSAKRSDLDGKWR